MTFRNDEGIVAESNDDNVEISGNNFEDGFNREAKVNWSHAKDVFMRRLWNGLVIRFLSENLKVI